MNELFLPRGKANASIMNSTSLPKGLWIKKGYGLKWTIHTYSPNRELKLFLLPSTFFEVSWPGASRSRNQNFRLNICAGFRLQTLETCKNSNEKKRASLSLYWATQYVLSCDLKTDDNFASKFDGSYKQPFGLWLEAPEIEREVFFWPRRFMLPARDVPFENSRYTYDDVFGSLLIQRIIYVLSTDPCEKLSLCEGIFD